jgi:hypothetical protein
MVTVAPFFSTLTTLLSESAALRMFSALAVTVPVLASAAHSGSRQRRSRTMNPTRSLRFIVLPSFSDNSVSFYFHFVKMSTCL